MVLEEGWVVDERFGVGTIHNAFEDTDAGTIHQWPVLRMTIRKSS